MGRPKKYEELDIYAPQKAYLKSEKGKEALRRYRTSEKGRANFREWARKKRGTIVDKRQWFIDTYGNIETALNLIGDRDQITAIDYYYGLNVEHRLKQTEIGEILGKSQSQVSDLIKKAKVKLEPLKQSVASSQN